ncbi:MAG TPA: galactokinase [Pyrinomonadaceae bacterium]|jgi:galactokinase|nr:galactokinase [Pyrinomonadaceae bacterium]
MTRATAVAGEFGRRFGGRPRVFRAPGRVNLIGEHTDYNEGFVMPAATDLAAWAAVAPQEGREVRVVSLDLDDEYAFSLDDAGAGRRGQWTDYVQGVALALEAGGFRLRGARLMVSSDVPIGSGLSSSAALEVSSARALLAAAEQDADPLTVARLCQRAENEFVGVRSGIMDQYASCFGREGRALLLDCRSLESEALPLPGGVTIVVCNTMVKHSLAGGEYNLRRADCEEAARLLGVRSLRDVTAEDFARRADELPERLRRRARHVVTENARVGEAAAALKSSDLGAFGRAMNESHFSLRDDYEVSCKELDLMADLGRARPGVYGARMMGGGFGGCTINLVEESAVEGFLGDVPVAYERETGLKPAVYLCRASEGAGEVTPA